MDRVNKCLIFILLVNSFQDNCVKSLVANSLIAGRETSSDEKMYLVSLQSEDEHFCGGSIIGEKYILTSAHCVINDDNEFNNATIKVVAGTNDLKNRDVKQITDEVEKIYVPERYNDTMWATSTPFGDIAVLKLKQGLDLKSNKNLKRLYLPRSNKRRRNKYNTYEGANVLISGFGWNTVRVKTLKNNTEYEIGSSSDKLFTAKAKVIKNDECQQFYESPIHETELCARVVEHDDDTPQGVCRGDSGGPLVYKSSTIIGVVSGISIGCNENNEPAIYCRVSSYMKFIRNAFKDNTSNMRIMTFI